MRIIIVPLICLLFASLLGFARAFGYVDFGSGVNVSDYYDLTPNEYYVNGTLAMNGSSTTVTGNTASVGMSAVLSTGIITLVVTAVALAVVSGITVMGSGLNSVSIMAIFKSTVYFGIWALFSVFALVLFGEVPIFGYPLYFILTLMYSVGIIQSVNFGGNA